MATATAPLSSKPRKHSVVRKSTNKPKPLQRAIAAKRLNGESKLKIARDLGVSRNTVTSVIALNNVEQGLSTVEVEIADQIAEYRRRAVALAPLAIQAIADQVTNGDGDLGLRLLERTGVVGPDAIDTAQRASVRNSGAINLLVRTDGGNITVHTDAATVQRADDNAKVINVGATVQPSASTDVVQCDNATVQPHNGNATVNCDTGAGNAPSPTVAAPPPGGKHPK